jgi:Tol biopolymer transport system component
MKTKLPFHLIILLSLLVAASPARAGAPASANFTSDSLSTPITTITRVSVDSSGVQGNDDSTYPSISADGRYVAFESDASNLVSGDTNEEEDVFLRDTQTGTTSILSVDSNGKQGNDLSGGPSISADGRYVAFTSDASNLVGGENIRLQIFLRDTLMGTTALLSLNPSGEQGNYGSDSPSISADGHYVAFRSIADNLVSGETNYNTPDILLRDTQNGTTTRVSVDSSGTQGNDDSWWSSISADGRYVAFASYADNLVSGDTTIGQGDIFLRDTQTGTTSLVSLDSSGTQGIGGSNLSSISADGRYVAFDAGSDNLVSGDTNNATDIFLRDTQTGITTRLSADSSGTQGNEDSWSPSISADGRYVAFCSSASNLVNGDTNGKWDIFVRDTQTGTTKRLSLDSSGVQGNDGSYHPSISADGRYVAFYSYASNLVSGDTNGKRDVFVVPASALFTLTVSKTGAGSGTVTSNPTGIDCGATCSASFDPNTSVNLTATAAIDSTFTGWNGSACSGTGTCTVTMDATKSVTASFSVNIYKIYMSLVIR